MYVNITIGTFNRLEYTREVLKALFEIDAGYPWKLTIVDNCSTDGTQSFLASFDFKNRLEKIILLNKNFGISYAYNLGWFLGPKDYYIKLDNDMVVQKKNWLFDLVDCADNIHKGAIFGYNVEIESYDTEIINDRVVRPKLKGNLGGACVIIPKRTFERFGYWYRFKDRVYGEEDAEYCFRIAHSNLFNIYMEDENAFVHLPAGRADMPGEKVEYREFKDKQRNMNLVPGSEYTIRMTEIYKQKKLHVNFRPQLEI